MVTLGRQYREPITGAEGIAVAKTDYLWGCTTIALAIPGLDKDSKPFEWIWFDGARLAETVSKIHKPETTGGPTAPSHYGPQR